MKYMLDTNICIYAIKNASETLLDNIISCDENEICISSITYAELVTGVIKSKYPEKNFVALISFLSSILVLPFDMYAAEVYGEVRANLENKGMPIGPMDTLIACHAKANNLTLVTNNTRVFDRVEGLNVENWA